MAASGKKNKKSKGKVLSLNEFLSDDHGRSGEAVVMAPSKSSWADEMEEEATYKEKMFLPTAPRAARGSDIDDAKIPNHPPYTAYIANLPYDIEVEDISKFFHGMTVKSVRLPREGGDAGRLRGFGYAEFETRQDLVDALTQNELMIKNRKIRVDVAVGADGDQEQAAGAGGSMGRGRGRPSRNDEEREDRTPSDWRNAPREMPQSSGGGGGQDRFRSERGGDRPDRDNRDMGGRYDASFNPRERAPGADRGPPERSSFGPPRGGGDRSFGRDRDGPSSFGGRDGPSSFSRDGGRDGSSSYGRDRDGPSSFSRDRDSGPPSYGRDRDGPSSYGGGRDRDGPSSFSRDRPSGDGNSYGRDREQRPPVEREAPKERPKLSLKPRSVPLEAEAPTTTTAAVAAVAQVVEPAVAATAPPVAAASIFGGAKPVDTAARERAIEERLKEKQQQQREKELPRGRTEDKGDDLHGDERGQQRVRSADKGEIRLERRDYGSDDRRRDGPSPPNDSRPVARDGDYRPPNRGGGEYRAPRGGDGDYRPPRSGGNDRGGSSGDYRSRNENGVSRGGGGGGSAGTYRAPNGSSRTPASSSNAPTDDATRIRRLEEPKQPVFENRNKFSYLLAEDEAADESDGRDEQ